MLTHLEGKLIEKSPAHAVMDCSGIGYYLHITVNTYSRIRDAEKCRLLTHEIVNQQDYSRHLYGFYDENERSIFRHLLSVSGVGASTARMILSSLSPAEVSKAVFAGNVSVFRGIKGIGEKTAQRIIIDLNGKLPPAAEKIGAGKLSVSGEVHNKSRSEALMALLALGFSKSSSEKAVDKILAEDGSLPVEKIVKDALKNF